MDIVKAAQEAVEGAIASALEAERRRIISRLSGIEFHDRRDRRRVAEAIHWIREPDLEGDLRKKLEKGNLSEAIVFAYDRGVATERDRVIGHISKRLAEVAGPGMEGEGADAVRDVLDGLFAAVFDGKARAPTPQDGDEEDPTPPGVDQVDYLLQQLDTPDEAPGKKRRLDEERRMGEETLMGYIVRMLDKHGLWEEDGYYCFDDGVRIERYDPERRRAKKKDGKVKPKRRGR